MQNWSLIYRALPKHFNSGSLENKKKNTRKNIFVGLTIFNRNKITFFNRTQSAVIRKKKILLLKTKDSTKRLHTFFFIIRLISAVMNCVCIVWNCVFVVLFLFTNVSCIPKVIHKSKHPSIIFYIVGVQLKPLYIVGVQLETSV